MQKSLFLCLILLWIGFGCTSKKGALYNPHEEAKKTILEAGIGSSDQKLDTSSGELASFDNLSSKDLIAKATQLSAEALAPKVLSNEGWKKSNSGFLKLRSLNAAILRVAQQRKDSLELQQILEAYDQALYKGCNDGRRKWEIANSNLQEGIKAKPMGCAESVAYGSQEKKVYQGCAPRLNACSNISYFKADPSSASVLKLLVAKRPTLQKQMRDYLMMFTLMSRSADNSALKQGWLTRLQPIFQEYIHLSNQDGRSRLVFISERVWSQIKNQTSVSKDAFSLSSKDYQDEFRQIVQMTSALLASETEEQVQTVLNPLAEFFLNWVSTGDFETHFGADFSSQISNLLAKRLESGDLRDRLKAELSALEAQGFNYFSKLKSLESSNQQILKNLNYEPIRSNPSENPFDHELSLYILGKLYLGTELSQATTFWRSAGKNPNVLLANMQKVVQLELLQTSLSTSKIMGENFRKHQAEGRDASKLLTEMAIWSNSRATPLWTSFHVKIERLKRFFEQEIEKNPKFFSDYNARTQIIATRNFFENINDNIKIYATYPNLIMMSYFAAKFNFRQVLKMRRLEVTFDKDIILDLLVHGRLDPILSFTRYDRDDEPLNELQILHAFQALLQMDVLAAYNISEEEFIDQFFSKYLEVNRKFIVEKLDKFRAVFGEGKPGAQFLQECQSFSNSKAFDRVMSFKDLQLSLFYGYPYEYQLANGLQDIGKFIASPTGAQRNMLYDEDLETLKSDVDPKMRLLGLFRDLLNINKPNLSQSAKNKLDSIFSSYLQLREGYFRKVKNQFFESRKCISKSVEIEQSRLRDVIQMERLFAMDVHSALTSLRVVKGDYHLPYANLVTKYNLKLHTQAHFKGIEKSSSLIKGLNEWLTNLRVYLPARKGFAGFAASQNGGFGFFMGSDGLPFFKTRVVDDMARLAGYLTEGYFEHQLRNSPERLTIQFPGSFREFNENFSSGAKSRKAGDAEVIYASSSTETQKAMIKLLNRNFWHFSGVKGFNGFLREAHRIEIAFMRYEHTRELDMGKLRKCGSTCLSQAGGQVGQKVKDFLARLYHDFQLFNLSEWDKDLLKLMDEQGFFFIDPGYLASTSLPSGPKGLFVADNLDTPPTGFLDQPFNYIVAYALGEKAQTRNYTPVADLHWLPSDGSSSAGNGNATERVGAKEIIERINPFKSALKIFPTLRDREVAKIFPSHVEQEKLILMTYEWNLFWDMRNPELFVKASEEYFKQIKWPKAQFSLLTESFEPYSFTPQLLAQYRKDIELFKKSTDNYFNFDQVAEFK